MRCLWGKVVFEGQCQVLYNHTKQYSEGNRKLSVFASFGENIRVVDTATIFAAF